MPSPTTSVLLLNVRFTPVKLVSWIVSPAVNPLIPSVPNPLAESFPATVQCAPASNTRDVKLVIDVPSPLIVPALAPDASSSTAVCPLLSTSP